MHQPVQKHKRHYEHVPIRVHSEHESAHEHYSPAPQSHRHAYSSQSIVHHTGHSGHSAYSGHQQSEESHNEHVAPVYQHVEEDEPAPFTHEIPSNNYQSIQYASPAPVHYEHSVHASKPQAHIQHIDLHDHHSQPHYSHDHEEQRYGHSVQHHETPVFHGHHAEEQEHGSHDEPVDYYVSIRL